MTRLFLSHTPEVARKSKHSRVIVRLTQTPRPTDESLQQSTQYHYLVLARKTLEILIIQISRQQFVLEDAPHLLRMLSHFSYYGGGIAAENLGP